MRTGCRTGFTRLRQIGDWAWNSAAAPYVLDGGNVVDKRQRPCHRHRPLLWPTTVSDKRGSPRRPARSNSAWSKSPSCRPIPKTALGHADGMAAFIGKNAIAIDPPRRARSTTAMLRRTARRVSRTLRIVEIESESPAGGPPAADAALRFRPRPLRERRGHRPPSSTCPSFGVPEDAAVLEAISAPAATAKSCRWMPATWPDLGGSVRCLGAQMKGENARRLIEAARR
jgi:hypothetical protein